MTRTLVHSKTESQGAHGDEKTTRHQSPGSHWQWQCLSVLATATAGASDPPIKWFAVCVSEWVCVCMCPLYSYSSLVSFVHGSLLWYLCVWMCGCVCVCLCQQTFTQQQTIKRLNNGLCKRRRVQRRTRTSPGLWADVFGLSLSLSLSLTHSLWWNAHSRSLRFLLLPAAFWLHFTHK